MVKTKGAIMIDKIKPIDKSWVTDRIRSGERYLRYCIDTIAQRKPKKRQDENTDKETEEAEKSPYDNLSVPKEKPHSFDENI